MKTFLDVSDSSASEESLLPLLEMLENMPLAVTLLATQAQYTSIPHLMECWNANKTAMLKRGGTGEIDERRCFDRNIPSLREVHI